MMSAKQTQTYQFEILFMDTSALAVTIQEKRKGMQVNDNYECHFQILSSCG